LAWQARRSAWPCLLRSRSGLGSSMHSRR
jgi:hypothetical protein